MNNTINNDSEFEWKAFSKTLSGATAQLASMCEAIKIEGGVIYLEIGECYRALVDTFGNKLREQTAPTGIIFLLRNTAAKQ